MSQSSIRDAHAAVEMAELAGSRLMEMRREMTGRGLASDVVKDAGDAAGQAVLSHELSTRFPNDAVLSEEAPDDHRRLRADRVWIVDPLDGTREFAELDRDDWAVHVALWQSGNLVQGAVALPARSRTFSTAYPTACPTPVGHGPLRLAVSRTRPPAFVAALASELGAEMVPMGSAGVKAMAVVTGDADAYMHGGGQYEWDSAAPVAVARAAGLFTSRLDGSPLMYNNRDPYLPDLLICHPDKSDFLLQRIARNSAQG